MPVPPQEPVITYYDPNKRDRGLIEYWATDNPNYTPLDLYTPHPNTRLYPGFKLGLQTPLTDNQLFVKRVWVSNETSPDWFNYEIKLSKEANNYPIYIRKYREDKKTYAPKAKGSKLDSIIKLVLTGVGSGYTPGTFPTVTFASGTATGHAIVNLDGTIASLVIDDQGSGYTSAPLVTIDSPPSGTTATGTAYIQSQGAVLTTEQAEEFPKDSEFFGIYFDVTRVYETLPGPTLVSTKLDEKDGVITTISTTRDLCANINTEEDITPPQNGTWTKTTKKETENQLVCEKVVMQRAIPGFPMVSTKIDIDGVAARQTQTYTDSNFVVTGETLVTGTWTRNHEEDVDGTTVVSWQFVITRTIPGPVITSEQKGKWGLEPVTIQLVELATATPDEGYFVRESVIEPYEGSSKVGVKRTIYYPAGLYGTALPGQDYDPRLNTVIPYIEKLQPIAYGIGDNFADINPLDYQHANVHTIDPATVQAVLDAYVFSYPGRINVDMPHLLTAVYGVINTSTSDGATTKTGTNSLTGAGSVSQDINAQSQARANAVPEAYPIIKQFWGVNIKCVHYHFFLKNPVTDADVLTKLNAIVGSSVVDWPKFNPETVTLVMVGGSASVQAQAESQGSYATSGTGTASTAAGGVGFSEERGMIVKTLQISPTIHDTILVSGSTYGSESVTSTAYAEAVGLGPSESQTTGPITVYASITPTTIDATVGAVTWPTSGLYLYRTDPNPYRYGYIEFHCVVVDATDFPNV